MTRAGRTFTRTTTTTTTGAGRRRAAAGAVAGVLLATLVSLPASADTVDPTVDAATGLPASAVAQIDALAEAKTRLTPTEASISSSLRTEIAQRSGRIAATGVPVVRTGVDVAADGTTSVDVAGRLDQAAVVRLGSLGAEVGTVSADGSAVRLRVPLTAVPAVAADPAVTSVKPAARAVTNRATPDDLATRAQQGDEQAKDEIAAQLDAAIAQQARPGDVQVLAGPVESEGVAAHGVDAAIAEYGVTGAGITIGVLSDGVSSLAASQEAGELPDVEVLPGQAGTGDEGTAMLEIVHDVAPGANLQFATAFSGLESFADNIRALRAAGADIIVDDIYYFAETVFQDGPIAQAVNDVTADGALYFSSAGNSNNLADGYGGTWEGDFDDSGVPLGKYAGTAHDFDPGEGVQTMNPFTTGGNPFLFSWSDPNGAATNDYDVYLLDDDGNVVAFSNDVQDGSQDPVEIVQLSIFSPFELNVVVVRFTGEDRFLHLDTDRGSFEDRAGRTGYATTGNAKGHSAAVDAFSVAAVPAAEAFGREGSPAGPFPGRYTAAQETEVFSSDGPRRMFYAEDGTPYTPGDVSSTGGVVRQKPDVTAADGVSTSVAGFETFFGTSAAAPHAAAIAALALSGNPGITPAEVRAAITESAIDIEEPGVDDVTGVGILMADDLLDTTGATPQAYVEAGEPTVRTTRGDGDPFLEAGEAVSIVVPVTNEGDAAANGVIVRVTSTTPGVVVRPSERPYGRLAVDATKTSQPYTLTVPAGLEAGAPIELAVTVRWSGAFSPSRDSIVLATGQPSDEVTSVSYAGPAVPIPDADVVGATLELDVADVGRLSGVTFSVDGTDCSTDPGSTTVGIDHTFVGDLTATLTAPDGTEVILFSGAGSGGANVCQAVFDDAAATSIQLATAADAPFTGSWQPAEPLATLVGADGDGTWQLRVVDAGPVDTGSVRAFTLNVRGFQA